MESLKKHHFVLVHGSCHGAWCWYKVINLLKLSGHRVTALDMAASGVHPKRLDEIDSFSDYVQPLMEFMDSLPQDEKVVLVGHSYGGLSISLAMENFPEKILVAVFLSACMPIHSSPPASIVQEFFKRADLSDFADCQFTFKRGLENLPTSALFGPNYMATRVYPKCKLEDLELATMLMRPSGIFIEDFTNKSMLTEDRYGSINQIYIVLEEDEVLNKEYQHWLIKNNPPKEVKSISGCDHMVMLSKPNELSLCLVEIADNNYD